MLLSIGSDHGGFILKENLKKALEKEGYKILDHGCFNHESVDYPLYAKPVCNDVQNKVCDYGILICTTGIGMSIVANKYKGIRAALVTNIEQATLTRKHNNSNVICLAAKYTDLLEAYEYVKAFISEQFSNEERHARRVKQIDEVKE